MMVRRFEWAAPVEVFFSPLAEQTADSVFWNESDNEPRGEGYYWWVCHPGCMPDSDPEGPFATDTEALEAARAAMEDN